MDCNPVALERMVAYKHLDMAMQNRLKSKFQINSLFIILFSPGAVAGGGPPVDGAAGCCVGG